MEALGGQSSEASIRVLVEKRRSCSRTRIRLGEDGVRGGVFLGNVSFSSWMMGTVLSSSCITGRSGNVSFGV
jgi:hypothetical protein